MSLTWPTPRCLRRAIQTLWIVLEEMNLEWIPVANAWQLNERHYGALQGLNKAETAEKFGEAQVKIWRRSYDTPPPALDWTMSVTRDFDRALRLPDPRAVARHRVAQDHAGAGAALLAFHAGAGDQVGQACSWLLHTATASAPW